MVDFLSVQEVAKRTGLSVSTIYREVKRGAFPPSVAISKGRRGWRPEDVKAWRAALDAA